MRTIRRNTARVLPVDREGRVLLLHGWDPLRPDDPFWFTIGGAAEPGESLPEAAARELREEAGIAVDPGRLGEPIEASAITFPFGGVRFEQDQTFFAVAIDDAEVSFAGQDPIEQATNNLTWQNAATCNYVINSANQVILPGLEHSVLVEAPARVLDLILGWLAEHRLAERGSA